MKSTLCSVAIQTSLQFGIVEKAVKFLSTASDWRQWIITAGWMKRRWAQWSLHGILWTKNSLQWLDYCTKKSVCLGHQRNALLGWKKNKHYVTDKHKSVKIHSLEHLLGSEAAQVTGHRVNAVQGRLHVQASDEILGAVLVEVKGQLGHICPLLLVAFAELIEVLAVLSRDMKWHLRQLERCSHSSELWEKFVWWT